MKLGFKDYRKTDDAVMVADVGFKRQLRALDPELDVVWNGNKWEIWRFPGQGKRVRKLSDPRATHVMSVQTQGRTFRELGADIIIKLQAGDLTRYSTKQICDYFDKMDDNIQRAKMNQFNNWFEDREKETFWYTLGPRFQIPERFMVGSLVLDGPKRGLKVRRAISDA